MQPFLFGRGRGDCFQLGHGNRESILRPMVIDSLAENLVIDIAVGYNHVVAVTQSRLFYFWGSHEPQVTEDVAVKTPVVVGKRVGSLNFGIAAGPSQVIFVPLPVRYLDSKFMSHD